MTPLMVIVGAAIGAPVRYLTDQAMRKRFGPDFPWATLTVNVAGSFILGLVLGLHLPPTLVALLGTGFCGALTTYSTFGWDTLTLARRGAPAAATAYVLLSVLAGLGAAALGHSLSQALAA
ncbi:MULTISPECIES: fluoride efflux transporter CrcB [Actinoplanes]|uniref:fluoride efflux transporter CrcB n=1 Tax=Actinoplanes TaxID=1865 RepID=UPI0005F290A1|nr:MULTISPECIES: fluoride efflux transporter CrcB [Actinoplanes]GLY05983.1 putative fluoride ion transporter CrcB 2 [Actinoplanes sp. NBRC 101535]